MMNGEQIVNDWLLLQGLDWRGDLTGLIDGAIENARKDERLKMLAELSGLEEGIGEFSFDCQNCETRFRADRNGENGFKYRLWVRRKANGIPKNSNK